MQPTSTRGQTPPPAMVPLRALAGDSFRVVTLMLLSQYVTSTPAASHFVSGEVSAGKEFDH